LPAIRGSLRLEEIAITTEELIVLVIVGVVCVVWDVLIAYQVRRGQTFAFSSQKWEAPERRSRATTPRAFWLAIGIQLIVPNATLLYLLWFASSRPA
jgi:hypothetical protein